MLSSVAVASSTNCARARTALSSLPSSRYSRSRRITETLPPATSRPPTSTTIGAPFFTQPQRLVAALAGLEVEQRAHRLAEHAEMRQLLLERLAIRHDLRILGLVAQHRHDHDLPRRDARRHAQAVIVAMHHDQPADHPGRHAPAGGLGELELACRVLEADVLRLAKLVPRKCEVPAWSALPSCIIASIE
jgi:hypothetical protein